MYLLILESIGTSELILVAIVALIVFGPRKLPQMAKTIGKTMAEFRNATNEFKTTWEREAAFEDDEKVFVKREDSLIDTVPADNTIGLNAAPSAVDNDLLEPKVRELSREEADSLFQNKENPAEIAKSEDEYETQTAPTKREWL